MARYGRLRLEKHPVHGLVLSSDRPPGARGGAARQEDRRHARRPARRRHRRGPPVRARQPQAGAAQARLAGRGLRRLRRRRGARDRPRRGRAGRCAPTSARPPSPSGTAAPASSCCPAAPARRSSARPRWPHAQATTLILVTNTVSARQWKDELVARTSLTADEIGEYSGAVKEVRPVTIATYQVLTTKRKGVYPHLELLDARDWGLIVYDEVHLLPAPIFRMTADLQARRRLGLTATLVREDGREGDVFSLIGPKRYDAPVEGHRGAGLHRARRLRRGAGHPAGRRAAGLRHQRARDSATASPPAPTPRSTSYATSCGSTPASPPS